MKGVSSVVAAALALVIVLAVFGALFTAFTEWARLQRQLVHQEAQRSLLEMQLQRSLAVSLVVNETASTGVITVTSMMPQPVLVQGVLVVFENWSAAFLDEANATGLLELGVVERVCQGVAEVLDSAANVILNPGCSLVANFTYRVKPITVTVLTAVRGGEQRLSVMIEAPAASAAAAAVPAGQQPTATPTATTTTTTTSPPPSYSMVLLERSAIAWDNFTEDPFAAGKLIPPPGYSSPPGAWEWDSTELAIKQTSSDTAGGPGNEAMVLINVTAYNSSYTELNDTIARRFYLLTAIRPDSTTRYHDLIAYQPANGFYEASLHNPDGTATLELWTWTYAAGWNQLDGAVTVSATAGNWYVEVMSYEYATSTISLCFHGPLTDPIVDGVCLSYSDGGIVPSAVGFGDWYTVSSWAWFVLTVNATPLYVNVTGLQAGWNVTLYYNATGTLVPIASGVADSSGVARLFVARMPIIPDAVFEVRDDTGNLVARLPVSLVVGGDLWRFTTS